MDLLALLRERRLLAIVRGGQGESVLAAVLALAREGVSLIEVSLTSAGFLAGLLRAQPAERCLRMGHVTAASALSVTGDYGHYPTRGR